MSETKKTMSLKEAGQHDFSKGLRSKLTGWGQVSKARTHDSSKSQRRKRARKG